METSGRTPQQVELKNGKILFKQRAIQFDKLSETLQEIVRFREMLTRCRDPILQIPPEYHSLIGKLSFESDKTLHVLSKSIRSQLLPEPIEVDAIAGTQPQSFENLLPLAAIESVVHSVAERVNYGLEQGQYGLTKPPAALCLWRWEVKDVSILPSQFKDKAEERKLERKAARMKLRSILDPLSPEMRASLLGVKGIPLSKESQSPAPLDTSKTTPDPMNKVAEDTVKDAPKPTAKAQKQQQEEAATKKSAAAFAKFFNKRQPPKTEILTANGHKGVSSEGRNAQSDYERTFHPFVLKKKVVMAPPNWFTLKKKDVIVIDFDEGQGQASTSAQGLLEQCLRSLPPGITNPRPIRCSSQYKLRALESVRDIIDKLTDAEVCGDEEKVFLLSKQLKDRRRILVKTLTFAEDSRPGYSGTWTRTTVKVGPRTPFARDVVALDYDCDSGEEWEEEAEGDEVLSGSDSGDGDGSDQDSLDGWLIDDDEDVGGEAIDLDQMDIDGLDVPNRKRKTSPSLELPTSKSKKRKFAKPLVPFSKGPCWEIPVGNCSQWEGLTPYRIQLFNDCTGPINPFTYVAGSGEANASHYRTGPGTAYPGAANSLVKTNHTNWKVPTQARLLTFPEEHIQALLHGIQRCKTASLNVLVDTLYQELKQVKVKKNSIERKVREIAEKRLDSDVGIKVWTVKLEYLQSQLSVA